MFLSFLSFLSFLCVVSLVSFLSFLSFFCIVYKGDLVIVTLDGEILDDMLGDVGLCHIQ